MAGTDALTGARYPGSSDSPNVNQDIQNAVNDLSDIIGGIFTTTAARDSAFSTWVSQGNTMRDGLTCRVGGHPQVYQGGSWHGVAPIGYSTTTVDATLYTINQTLMTLSIPDPLFPYKLLCSGQIIFATLGAGVTAGARIRVNGTDLIAGNDAINSSGSNVANVLTTVPPGMTGSLSGASTVTVFISKAGPAGNGYQAGNTGGLQVYDMLSVLVIPA